MARPLRIEYEGAFYHVTCRGNERKRIFYGDNDKKKFLDYIHTNHFAYRYKIHTWCLMDNHYHLLIETSLANISKILQRLNSSYTTYFNRKRKRVGHLFGGRPKIILVEKDTYALQLSRYIHLNPVRACIVTHPEDYFWSSYRYFIKELPSPDYLETAFLLRYFGDKIDMSKNSMKAFVEEGIEQEIKSPLNDVVGGILLGNEGFITWVKDVFVASRDNDREIVEIKKLKQIEPNKITRSVETLFNRDDKLTQEIEIYLLRKYSDKTLQEIGREYSEDRKLGISGISHIVRRLENKRQSDRLLDDKIRQLEEKILSPDQGRL